MGQTAINHTIPLRLSRHRFSATQADGFTIKRLSHLTRLVMTAVQGVMRRDEARCKPKGRRAGEGVDGPGTVRWSHLLDYASELVRVIFPEGQADNQRPAMRPAKVKK